MRGVGTEAPEKGGGKWLSWKVEGEGMKKGNKVGKLEGIKKGMWRLFQVKGERI